MHVAFLGVGEVGSTLAMDLLAQGVQVSGWDPNPRYDVDGLQFATSNPNAVLNADAILSTNVAAVSVEVAREVLPYLKEGQLYADLNTAAPAVKREIDALFQNSAAIFADVAIMSPIKPKGIQSPMFASGEGAAQFADYFTPFKMPVTVLAEPAGQAATQKLVRSIFYKGLAAVVMETLEAAEKLDLTDYARQQMLTILTDDPMIDRLVEGSIVHARRRIHEMDAVIELLAQIQVSSHSSNAARQRLLEILGEEPIQ